MKCFVTILFFAAALACSAGTCRAALNFTDIDDSVTPTQSDLNAGIGGSDPGALNSSGDGNLSFGNTNAPNPSSAFTDVTLNNSSPEDIGTWRIDLMNQDQSNSFPGAFEPVILTVSSGSQSFQISGSDGNFGFNLINPIASGGSDTLRFAFSSSSPNPGTINFASSVTGISVTALVPEPSSALLLTGVLGLFGGTFRRRRRMPAE